MRRVFASATAREEARQGLHRFFGHEDFRPAQADVIGSVLSGRNTVVVMPTGAGKSLCYQLPAVLLPGVTVVVSPLIALMKDQVEQLQGRGISATFINSTPGDLERADRLRKMRAGAYKLIYVAPERFKSGAFLDALGSLELALFAVDEAHCISQWGHDFRPDYALLGQVRKRLRPPRTVALTATATPEVRDDITRSLLMKDPQVFVAGFDRKNLFLEVAQVKGDDDRRELADGLIRSTGGSGIIYCATRKNCESMHDALKARGHKPVLYHAGMDDEARRRAQDAFMGSPKAVAVATNAFGMGIDKPDIRFVVHANIPRAVEAYYQEIGRAGRDGQPGHALLLFNHSDVYTQERLIGGNYPADSVLSDVWHQLRIVDEYDHGLGQLAAQVGASEFEVGAAVRILERAGKVVRGSRGEGPWQLTLTAKADKAQPHSEEAQALLKALLEAYPRHRPVTTEVGILARRAGVSEAAARKGLALLEKSGAVEIRRPFSGRSMRVVEDVAFQELGLDLTGVREQERRSLLLLRRMTEYAYTKRCRRAFVLRYFGEDSELEKCGGCDVCEGPRVAASAPSSGGASSSSSGTGFGDAHGRSGPAAITPGSHSELALSELRAWRKALAKDLDVPAYIIFPDAALLAIATALPIDEESFLRVKGTGPARWERFGAKVREICTLARAAGDAPQPVPVRRARRRK